MWFKKHLNLTYFFSVLIAYIIYYAVFKVFMLDAESYLLFSGFAIIAGSITLAAVWGVGAWVISQKKRNLFYLLWLLLGIIGIIVILCLQNRSNLKPEAEKRADEIGQYDPKTEAEKRACGISQDKPKTEAEKRAEKTGQDNLRATSWRQRR